MQNLSKPNQQVFAEYLDLIASSKSEKWHYETRRLLDQFREFLGEFPPSIELFTRFFTRYSKLAASTRSRYYFVFSGFFKWYNQDEIPFKIRVPKHVPQKVTDESFEKLIEAIASRKTHKKKAARDILLVETAYHTGLRRGELSGLEFGDLQLEGGSPSLRVRRGKGAKDRVVPLNPYIRNRLATAAEGKKPTDKVFNLSAKTISMKLTYWARKAGVPSIHTHSMRHKFATDMLDRGGNIRAVQQLLGHSSLGTTENYLAVTDSSLRDSVNLLAKKQGTMSSEMGGYGVESRVSEPELRLHLKVREVELIGCSGGIYLVLLRITFANLTPVGKIVYHLGSGAPGKQQVSKADCEYYDDRRRVTISLSGDDQVMVDVETSELLILPLDIPPRESRSRWMPLQIHTDAPDSGTPQVPLVLIAKDISGDIIAEYHELVELKTYMIP